MLDCFFTRSEYVYLPGLGNLEIRKAPSTYSSEFGMISPSKAEILFKPTIGVIDDSFANFVANNERVSIASAANAISDFGKRVKAEIAEGSRVEIPGIGHFYNNNGQVGFEVSPNYEYVPKSIPVFKNVSDSEEYRKEKGIKEIIENTTIKDLSGDDEIVLERVKINYPKLITLILIGLLVLGGIGYLVYYFINQGNAEPKVEQTTAADLDVPPTPQAPQNADTQVIKDTVKMTALGSAGEVPVIVNEYTQQPSADARVRKLSNIGYKVESIVKDSVYYVVVHLAASSQGDQFVADSIRPILNPRYDVRVLK
ncbi:MAG: HU family DNA-binding protein [Taibaiella sp.]|nr:HU family DNA-binding protein [Taibaiella sp.]